MKEENTVLYVGGGLVLILVLAKLSQQKTATASANSSSLSGILGGGVAVVSRIGSGLKSLFGSSSSSPVDIPTNNNGGSLNPGSSTSPFFGPDVDPSSGDYQVPAYAPAYSPENYSDNPGT